MSLYNQNTRATRNRPSARAATGSKKIPAGVGGSAAAVPGQAAGGPGPRHPLVRQNDQRDAMEKIRTQIADANAAANSVLQGMSLSDLALKCDGHKLGESVTGWQNPFPKDDPRSLLLQYQHTWSTDPARFKAGLMSRQVGKDFSSECEVAVDCNRHKTEWMIAAPSERQALDSLEQGKTWAQAFDLKIADYQEARESSSETLLKSAEITYSNGSRHRAVPGRPDTVRGRSANLLLTEFDFFENPDATWRAVLPSITNPLRGGEKKVRLITTPNGQGGAMHAIWKKADTEKMKWSRHLVTIYHAVLMGLPVDIAQLREAFNDPDGWAQEFECQFLDAAAVLLPYELIIPCENPLASAEAPVDFWLATGGAPIFSGIDFGRKKDLTVCWSIELIGGAFKMTREVLELSRMSTPDQINILRPRIRRAQSVSFDYTGPGVGMGDYLVQEFGEYNPEQHKFGKIELCTFTNNLKVDVFSKLRMEFEKRLVGVPVNRTIREDLHLIHRITLAGGGTTYRAPHTPDGHADRTTGLALAIRAASRQGTLGNILVPSGRRSQVLAGRHQRSIPG